MASHHSAKLGADRHLSSGDMMSLVVEGHMPSFRSVIIGYLQNTRYAMLTHNKFQDVDTIICRYFQWKTLCPGNTCLPEELTEITQKISASPSKNSAKKKEKKKRRLAIAKLFVWLANGLIEKSLNAFGPIPLISRNQIEVLKFNNICASKSSPKVGVGTDFLNLGNSRFENVSFS